MKFTTSINIERDINSDIRYIPTPNAISVANQIISGFQLGIHSFNIIGSYGTGKSSFILALEKDLNNSTRALSNVNGQFNGLTKFEFLNIVGDYTSLSNSLGNKLGINIFDSKNLFDEFDNYYHRIQKENRFLFVVIDEFGKVLEHAAKNNPEQELYFLQKFSEYVNGIDKNIILITTLHQSFSAYANKLTKEQRNEWEKVKGRFKEIVFNEPVEQLLYLASERLKEYSYKIIDTKNFDELSHLAIQSKFVNSKNLTKDLANTLYPLDIFSAATLTLAIQRYGQNERSLFTFLESAALTAFEPKANFTYNLAKVYDYLIYNFYSYLSEVHKDSANWTAIKVALERVDGNFYDEKIDYASKIVKTIGLFNIFASSGCASDKPFLIKYAQLALGIDDPEIIIDRLEQLKIIRFAKYKSQYILFEGTDVDIEAELLKAGAIVPKAKDFIDKLKQHFNFNVVPAKAVHYETGTPRFFQFEISNAPLGIKPSGEIDGFVNLIFSNQLSLENIIQYSKDAKEATLYAYFQNTEDIINQIFEIDKYQYILERVVIDKEDRVARREFEKGLAHEQSVLNQIVMKNLFTQSENVTWIFGEKKIEITGRASFNKTLSDICRKIYSSTPIFKNELVNKHKVSGTISTARIVFLQMLLENYSFADLDFPESKFPPEKSIYLSLLKNTGIHKVENSSYVLGQPIDESFQDLWNTCEEFLKSSISKGRKISDLIKILQEIPFKLKQGFIEIWIPTYLIIRKEDYALYSNGNYIPNINKEVLELLQRTPNEFSIKAFSVEGIRLDLFNKYREVINLGRENKIEETSFIETIKPFLTFYNRSLNEYARKTRKLQRETIDFREVLATATDPEQTFFEDIPRALGFKDVELVNNDEFLYNFVEIIQNSIRELRSCYSELINRIESYLLSSLGIKTSNFDEYKIIIESRYRDVKQYLLPPKQKAFYSRVTAHSKEREAWINSISYVILNKSLDSMLDEEEEFLLDKLKYSFAELANFVDLHKNIKDKSTDQILKLDITTIDSGTKTTQVIIPEQKQKETSALEEKIKKILSDDDNINIYALIQVLNKKIKK